MADGAAPAGAAAAAAAADAHAHAPLRIGILGFGTFGQFLAERMLAAGHAVLAWNRSDQRAAAARLGVEYFSSQDDFCEQHPEVVILCTSILSLERIVAGLPLARLRRSTLFVDVASVKSFPRALMLARLPPEADLLCSHPMFGPDSGKGDWAGLNFMFERVRVGEGEGRPERCAAFLGFFAAQGCRMVEMTCEEHDRAAASTQFITHTVGRTLGAMGLARTPIDTKGFGSLMSLVEHTAHDSFDLYYGLFMYNPAATEELDRLERAFDGVKKELFKRLHERVRSQLFSAVEGGGGVGANGVGTPGGVSGAAPAR